ncbi:hypothetical protein [Bacillus sp. JJ1562]|uniref:hypothetical protein n=1 Tax=Bacillus sp. JJ1562 TaxID=3122960 RepID=UPI003002BC19
MERFELQRFLYKDGKLFERPLVYGDQWEEVKEKATFNEIEFTKEELIKILKAFGDCYLEQGPS